MSLTVYEYTSHCLLFIKITRWKTIFLMWNFFNLEKKERTHNKLIHGLYIDTDTATVLNTQRKKYSFIFIQNYDYNEFLFLLIRLLAVRLLFRYEKKSKQVAINFLFLIFFLCVGIEKTFFFIIILSHSSKVFNTQTIQYNIRKQASCILYHQSATTSNNNK